MKIEIELPDWVEERHLFILAGVELAAYRNAFKKEWHIKTSRCNQCGTCCTNLPKGQHPLDENNNCIHLVQEGTKRICKLGLMQPFPCLVGDPVKAGWGKDFCSVRYDGEK